MIFTFNGEKDIYWQLSIYATYAMIEACHHNFGMGQTFSLNHKHINWSSMEKFGIRVAPQARAYFDNIWKMKAFW